VISTPSNIVLSNRSWVRDLLGIAIFLGIFYALWIGAYALITPDEGRYSEVAREMVSSGDYITPRLNGVAFLDKPVLYYWLQASAIKLFGLKEWALRFWPATLGILCALMTYVAGRVVFNRRTGLIAALMLATSPLYYGGSHYANLDLEVASLVSDSLLCFLAAMSASAQRWRSILLFAAYGFAGLAALTKGLIGIVFPAMIIGTWIIILNRWRLLKSIHLLSGILIFALITVPWYYLVQKANPEFFHYFFVTQQVSRFLTMQEFNSKAAVWFYAPIVLAGFFPWTVFLFQAIGRSGALIWKDRQQHAAELFILLWLVMIFVFFSVPRSKTVGYILPVFPACALLVANYLNIMWAQTKAKGIFAGVAFFAIFTCLFTGFVFASSLWAVQWETPANFIPYLRSMACVLLFAMFGSFFLLSQKKTLAPLFSFFTVASIAVLLIFINSTPTINAKSIKPIAVDLKSRLNSGDEVAMFYKYYHDLSIYLERRITIVADWHAKDIEQHDNWLREMWYGMVFQNTQDWLIQEDVFWQRWNADKRMYVVTDMDDYNNLKSKTHAYIISQHNDDLLVSNRPDSLTKNPELAGNKSNERQNS
jgi:4-amino-4-deoxy-L-arabinose transferase-like glycosyltransferase